MTWKKHVKKTSELKKSNTEIDMLVRRRLMEMTKEMLDQDMAISLEFLKGYLHLQKQDSDAIEELKFLIGLTEGVEYGIIADDTDQSVYVFFTKKI